MPHPNPDHPILRRETLLVAIRTAVRREEHKTVTELDRKLRELEPPARSEY